MEEVTFRQKIANSTAHRPIRDEISEMIFKDVTLLPVIVNMALDVSDKNHHKACWSLELVFEKHIGWLTPYMADFCKTLSLYKSESAIRSIAKICLFAAKHSEKNDHFLSAIQKELITESCFDWLIGQNGKTANMVYAMRTLFIFGKNDAWIYPELTRIISENYAKGTPGYKSAAKKMLYDIKTQQEKGSQKQ